MRNTMIGTAEIAGMLGVTRAYATDVITKQVDFPAPAVSISQRIKRWNESDVRAWLDKKTAKRVGGPQQTRNHHASA